MGNVVYTYNPHLNTLPYFLSSDNKLNITYRSTIDYFSKVTELSVFNERKKTNEIVSSL